MLSILSCVCWLSDCYLVISFAICKPLFPFTFYSVDRSKISSLAFMLLPTFYNVESTTFSSLAIPVFSLFMLYFGMDRCGAHVAFRPSNLLLAWGRPHAMSDEEHLGKEDIPSLHTDGQDIGERQTLSKLGIYLWSLTKWYKGGGVVTSL